MKYWDSKTGTFKKSKSTGTKTSYGKTYGSYGSGYGKSYNSGGYKSVYDWGGWSFDDSATVSGSERYIGIKNPENYNTPSRVEIEDKFNQMFQTSYRGTYIDTERIQEMARYFYFRMIDEKDYLKELKDINYGEQWLNQKKELYESMWEQDIPGFTPLEKALSLHAKAQSENKTGKKIEREDMMDGDDITEEMIEGGGTEFSEDWWDYELNELFKAKFKNKKLKMLNQISLLKQLGARFEVSKEITERIVANSNKFKKKILRDYSMLPNIDFYQMLMPNFKVKFALKDLTINAPIDRKENKQKIIILVDYSGSMNTPDKQDWVITILADRLRYVMKGEAEIYFSYYVYDPSSLHFHHIYDKQTALKFWSTFSTSPNGGDTNIGAIIHKIKQDIQQNRIGHVKTDFKEGEKPEILVIHDGQDSVKTSNFGYKTNAITMLDGVNKELKTVCLNSQGSYVYIPHGTINKNNPIMSYELHGKTEVEKAFVV